MAWIDDRLAAGILRLIERRPGQLTWYNIEIRMSGVRQRGDSIPIAVLQGLVKEGYLNVTDDGTDKYDITESGRAFLEAHSRDAEHTPGA